MANSRDSWSGTLMLIGQPAEEKVGGAKMMMEDHIWQRFGKPDYALALHVSAEVPNKWVLKLPAPIAARPACHFNPEQPEGQC